MKLAVGTDGPASNNALDMFREMYLPACCKSSRSPTRGLPGREHPDGGLLRGAKAMGLENCDKPRRG